MFIVASLCLSCASMRVSARVLALTARHRAVSETWQRQGWLRDWARKMPIAAMAAHWQPGRQARELDRSARSLTALLCAMALVQFLPFASQSGARRRDDGRRSAAAIAVFITRDPPLLRTGRMRQARMRRAVRQRRQWRQLRETGQHYTFHSSHQWGCLSGGDDCATVRLSSVCLSVCLTDCLTV